MFTKITTLEDLKAMFVEVLLNKTDAVSKVSDGSVVNGVAYGAAKLAQKLNKEIAIIETHIFPDSATGQYLDDIGRLEGISPRFGAKQSSTYVLVVGAPGTAYLSGVNTFKSKKGTDFIIDSDYTIGQEGFGYVKVRSVTTGVDSNVEPLSINNVTPKPTGHSYCVNEYGSQYGSDRDNDDVFRSRVKEGVDLLSKDTISKIEQVFMKANENILKVYYGGIDDRGRIILRILTENGISLSSAEINDLILRSEKFFSLTEFRPSNFNGYGVSLLNIDWQPIDISMRIDIDPAYSVDDVRKQIQMRFNKYLDYRYWSPGSKVEWDNLLFIAKQTDGVRYINDSYFYPSSDIQTDLFKLPRIRGFRMLDLNGNLIIDLQNTLNPVYYPNQKDFSFIATVLQNI